MGKGFSMTSIAETMQMPEGTRLIPLTKGRHALIDEADFARATAFTWSAGQNRRGGLYYAVRQEGPRGRTRRVYLHRFLVGAACGEHVDHQNGDTLDCRRGNLRRCSHQQNMQNQWRLRRGNQTGFRGVSWNQKAGKYQAFVGVNGKSVWCGQFTTAEEAAHAAAAGRAQLMTHSSECVGAGQ